MTQDRKSKEIKDKFSDNLDYVEKKINYKKENSKDEFDNLSVDLLVEGLISDYPELYSSLKDEFKTINLRIEILERNRKSIRNFSKEEVSKENIKEYFKEMHNILLELDFLSKEELRDLLYYINESNDCVFTFPLEHRLDLYKQSRLLNILIEEKELMTSYLNTMLKCEKNDIVDVRLTVNSTNIFFQHAILQLKSFFKNKENNEYFICNFDTSKFLSRDIFLLVLEGNQEINEKYFVEAVSVRDDYFDFSIYIREIILERRLEKESEDNRIAKRKI